MTQPMTPPSKKLEEIELFFPIILKKTEFDIDMIQFLDIEAECLLQKYIDNYSLGIYYGKTSMEKSVKEFELNFKIDKDEFKLTLKIKNKVDFAFKSD